ncbi:sll1863 family stress response protein [Sneathiella sp.]|jgi:septal ring factor EnvC (AmiA/AmiB activator)|uniref:hypothetical protein n=1 Tax=Sneathiella sp. TaxID=1964365 RepID=UPI0025D71271|nr:hypothetical protein [Sneathiella sp.]|tara:strand:- start:288 stop:764 length:477 start_codon:yes stop_codon:yes gene_type:complete
MKILKAMTVGTVAATMAFGAPVAFAANTSATTSESDVSVEDVQAKISETFDSISNYTVDQRDEAVESIKETLAELDQEIDELEADARDQWADMSEATREKTSAALVELRKQRNMLGEQFGAMQQGADSTWDDMKAGLADAWAAVKEAWQNVIGSEKAE